MGLKLQAIPNFSIALERKQINLFYSLIFLYFLTLSADVLHLEVSLFKIKINNIFSALLLLFYIFSRRGLILSREILNPFLCILISLILSASLSIYPMRCFGYVGVYIFEFCAYFLLPFTFLFHFNREKILRCYFLSFIIMGSYAFCQLLFSMIGIYTPLLRQVIEEGGWARPHGLSYEPSFYALYMTAFVMFYNAHYFFSKNKKKILKLIFINWLLLLSTSTSGFFAYGFFFFLIFIFRPFVVDFKKKIFVFCSALTCFIAVIFTFAPKMIFFFFKFFTSSFFTHHSFAERWKGIEGAWDVFCDCPFFGVGIGGIGPYLFYKNDVGMMPEGSLGLNLQEVEIYDPKNVATEILGGLGLFGLVAFFWFISVLYKRFKAVFFFPERERNIALSLFISLFVMILLLQFNSGLFRCYVWVHTAITLGYSASLSSNLPPSAMSS